MYVHTTLHCTNSHTHPASVKHSTTHCNTLPPIATHYNTLQHTTTERNTLRCAIAHTPPSAHSTTYRHTAPKSATQCYTLQHTSLCQLTQTSLSSQCSPEQLCVEHRKRRISASPLSRVIVSCIGIPHAGKAAVGLRNTQSADISCAEVPLVRICLAADSVLAMVCLLSGFVCA